MTESEMQDTDTIVVADEPQQPQQPQHVEDLWFEDGNLILRAENSLFRIYSGILAARSSVFRDMLSFPQPLKDAQSSSEDDPDRLDGCPIVQVYDPPEDLTYFLKAIFDSAFFEPPSSKTCLPIVASMIRLATKYDVQYLRKRAMLHFESAYPTTLAAWCERERVRTIPPVDDTPFAILQLAREFDLTWILPAVMYCISTHAMGKTFDGVEWDGAHLDMSWDDKKACLSGRAKLLQAQQRNAVEFLKQTGVAGCPSEEACSSGRVRLLEIITAWETAGFLDFVEENQGIVEENLCKNCFYLFKDTFQLMRQALWDELPSMFDLPTWEELERQKTSAFE